MDNKKNERLSSIRFGLVCSSRYSDCNVSADAGQFKSFENMEEVKTSLSFPVVLLDEQFRTHGDFLAQDNFTPYIIILPHSISDFKRNEKFKNDWEKYTRFYTPDRIFPDFSMREIWVFNRCNSNNDNRKLGDNHDN
jgi:hypothetical protein